MKKALLIAVCLVGFYLHLRDTYEHAVIVGSFIGMDIAKEQREGTYKRPGSAEELRADILRRAKRYER